MPTFDLPVPDIAPWRAGNTGVEGVWHFDSGASGEAVLISALIHGNELCGAWALKGLLEAGLRPARGTLTLAFGNLAAFDRFDAADPDAARFVQQDLNRQWTPERIQAADTLERRRAAALAPFVQRASWLLDLHSMHEPGAPLLLTGLHERNLDLARSLRTPGHIVIDAGHQDGVRMRDFGRFGQPDHVAPETRSLLLECGFHGALS
ncbi:MAG: succinylglutamate desuccinylase/aspartoacylase family protein, partial [Proteobacteria bacterium]|nr:succinylglutamate desuccinylase/aspartoacylase family protein [Pseudomonadota bacterium]